MPEVFLQHTCPSDARLVTRGGDAGALKAADALLLRVPVGLIATPATSPVGMKPQMVERVPRRGGIGRAPRPQPATCPKQQGGFRGSALSRVAPGFYLGKILLARRDTRLKP